MNELTKLFTDRSALVAGQITHDQYDSLLPGGCAYFASKTIEALGGSVSLLTSVGLDFAFDSTLENMQRVCRIGECTTTFLNVYPSCGPRIQYISSQAPPITLDMLPGDWTGNDLLLLAPVMGELDGAAWKRVRDAGHVSLLLQGFMKRANIQSRDGKHLVVPLDEGVNLDILENVDSVFLSEEDIVLFASSRFLDELVERVKIVAVTRGELGCRIYYDGTYVDVGVFEVEAVDSTGAGDTFAAATAMGLACGMSVDAAGRLGAATASIVVEGLGGQMLPSIGLAWQRYDHVPVFFEEPHRRLSEARAAIM